MNEKRGVENIILSVWHCILAYNYIISESNKKIEKLMVSICQGFRLYYLQTNYNLFIIKFTNTHVKTMEMYKLFLWNGKISNYFLKNKQSTFTL